ncbi:MAG: type VII secretion EssA family protein [Cetobacterium sp.]
MILNKMDDNDYLPVRPNVNNYTKRPQSSLSQNIIQPPISKKENLSESLMKNRDPDVQQIVNKKQNDVLTMQSKETKEEKEAKESTSTKESDSSKESKGTSWIIIILAVVIILLILVIIYYAVNYANLFPNAPPIPENVVKPNNSMNQIDNPYIHSMPPKPKDYIEPTKNDLDSVLSQLNKPISQNSEKMTNNKTNIKDNPSQNNPNNIPIQKPRQPPKSAMKQRQIPKNMPVITEIEEDSSDISDESGNSKYTFDMEQKNETSEVIEIDISEEMKNSILEYEDDYENEFIDDQDFMDRDTNEEFIEQAED